MKTAIRNAFWTKHHLLAFFYDLEKAYDTTWKHSIAMKLFEIGLQEALPALIQNCLADRTFKVRVVVAS